MEHTTTTEQSISAVEANRLHYMDNVRALAMTLGLFFHASIAYSPSLQNFWLTANASSSTSMEAIFSFSHLFRMPLFFLIAGFFAFMLIEKRGIGGFLRHRALRIFLPFVVFLPIITALVIWAIFWAIGKFENLSYVLSYIKSLMENPEQADNKLSTMHLWFLYNLCFFSALFSIFAKFKLFESRAFKIFTNVKILVFVFPLLIIPSLSSQIFPFPPPDKFYPQLWSFGFFGLFFLVGAAFYQKPELTDELAPYVPAFLIVSLVAQVILFAQTPDPMTLKEAEAILLNGPPLTLQQIGIATLEAIAASYMTFTCLVLGKKLLSTSNKALRYISRSSYWVYIVHIPVLFYLQFYFLDIHWNPWLEFAITSIGTFAICLITYQLFVSWTFIGWMLNGRKKKPTTTSGNEPAVA